MISDFPIRKKVFINCKFESLLAVNLDLYNFFILVLLSVNFGIFSMIPKGQSDYFGFFGFNLMFAIFQKEKKNKKNCNTGYKL